MTLRLAAAAALALGLALTLAFLHRIGEGPFADAPARHLRAMKERVAVPAAAEAVTLEWMHALPEGPPSAASAALERRAVTMEGAIQRMVRATDGDLHLEVVPAPSEGYGPYVTAEVTPAFQRRHPGWRHAALAAATWPWHSAAGAWPGPPRRVRVTGWLLHDHEQGGARTAGAAPRVSHWEIHPVTGLEVYDEAAGAWVEVGA